MKKIIIGAICFITMGYIAIPKNPTEEISKTDTVTTCKSYDKPIQVDSFYNFIDSAKPYNIHLKLNPTGKNTYDLIIDMRLNNGAHFVSPNAKRDFSGKFKMVFNENTQFEPNGKLIEFPLSVEEHDPHPFVNGPVNWVRQNTTYTQKLKLNTTKDFTVNGVIQFTIEPRCTLEKIPIVIYKNKDELKFEIDNC